MARMIAGWEFRDFKVTDGREVCEDVVQVLGLDNGTVRLSLLGYEPGSPWYGNEPVIEMTVHQATRLIEELEACRDAARDAAPEPTTLTEEEA